MNNAEVIEHIANIGIPIKEFQYNLIFEENPNFKLDENIYIDADQTWIVKVDAIYDLIDNNILTIESSFEGTLVDDFVLINTKDNDNDTIFLALEFYASNQSSNYVFIKTTIDKFDHYQDKFDLTYG